MFGQTAPAATTASTSLFGGFGQTAQQVTGTTVKFNPPTAQDTAQKGSIATSVTTKHMVITAMKEYEGKSLEELRLADYKANRRTGSAGSTTAAPASGGLFGSTPAAATASKPLFGAATTQPSLFGGATASATQPATSGFSFGATPAPTGGLFGSPATSTAPTAAAAPFSFGATAQKPALSLAATTASAFSFGTPAQPAAGLAGAKPAGTAAPFGQTSTFGAFGSQPAQTTTASSGFSFGGASTATTGGLFSKPATSAAPFSFPSTSTAPAFGQPAATTQSSLFGGGGTSLFSAPAATTTTASSGFSFGGTAAPAAPFGSSTQPTTGFQFPSAGASQPAPAFGGPAAGSVMSNVETISNATVQALVHQKLLSLARCQPAYSVMFRESAGGTDGPSPTVGASRLASDLGTSSNASSFLGRSSLPHDGYGSLRSNFNVSSALPCTTMTSKPHSTSSSLFDLKPRFGLSGNNTSRLGLTWSSPQQGTCRWSPNKTTKEANAVSPRSVISPLSLAPRHSIRQLIPKRFSMTMDNTAVDMSTSEAVDQNTRDLTMHDPLSSKKNPNCQTGGGGLLGTDISVVRPEVGDNSFVDRVEIAPGGGLPSSTPLNPRPASTPRGRHSHVPLIKIEEHQTPASNPTNNSNDNWRDDFGDGHQISPENKQRSSVQRKQQLLQQTRPILRRPGFYSIPAIAEIQPTISENSEDGVEWFADELEVHRDGYGSVTFHGRVNLTGLNLDQLSKFYSLVIILLIHYFQLKSKRVK